MPNTDLNSDTPFIKHLDQVIHPYLKNYLVNIIALDKLVNEHPRKIEIRDDIEKNSSTLLVSIFDYAVDCYSYLFKLRQFVETDIDMTNYDKLNRVDEIVREISTIEYGELQQLKTSYTEFIVAFYNFSNCCLEYSVPIPDKISDTIEQVNINQEIDSEHLIPWSVSIIRNPAVFDRQIDRINYPDQNIPNEIKKIIPQIIQSNIQLINKIISITALVNDEKSLINYLYLIELYSATLFNKILQLDMSWTKFINYVSQERAKLDPPEDN
ncbi:MAG: hypothetical protein ACE14V_05315 [bacterium]